MGQDVGAEGQVYVYVYLFCDLQRDVQWVCRENTWKALWHVEKTRPQMLPDVHMYQCKEGPLSASSASLPWLGPPYWELYSCSKSKLSKAHETPEVEFGKSKLGACRRGNPLPLGWSQHSTSQLTTSIHFARTEYGMFLNGSWSTIFS